MGCGPTDPATGTNPDQPCDSTRQSCPYQCKPITSITVVAVKFLSDHDLLKDYTADWKDGGTRFAKPEWTAAVRHPLSHSLDEKVKLEVTIEVLPKDACPETGDLKGVGPEGYSPAVSKVMEFKKAGVRFQHGMSPVTLESDLNVIKTIQKLDFRIDWTSTGTSVALSGRTANPVFVTIAKPRDPGQASHGVTLKRMELAVGLVAPMATTNPQTIVHELMKKLPYYVLHANPAVPSKFSHPNYFNAEGGAWPIADYLGYYAECQAIVRFVRKIIKQLGAPGDGEMVYVFADPATPLAAKEDPEGKSKPALHSHPGFALVDQKVTAADIGRRYPPSHTRLPDGSVSMGFNAYEACLKFTAKDGPEGKSGALVTYYYPGGTGGSRQNDIDTVLKKSFFALVQMTGAWYPTDADVNKVWGLQIVKIVADYTPFH